MAIQNKERIYETTVYTYTVRINHLNLTKKGYYDLTKIVNLRIFDQGLIKLLRLKYNKTQKDLARFADVPLRTLIGWESYNKSIPFKKLILISNKLNIKEGELYEKIKTSYFTVGAHHGKTRIRLDLRPNEFQIAKYVIPHKYNKNYVLRSCPNEIKKIIIKIFSIDSTYYYKRGLVVIYSKLLNIFLRTFYVYQKEIKLDLPISKEVNKWIKQKIDLKKAVIIPLALSDGGEKPKNRLFYSGECQGLHKIWTDAFYYSYKLLPSSYLLPYKSIFVTTHIVPKENIEDLKKICPNFKTSPVKQTKQDYNRLPQPTAGYLLNANNLEQKIALRLWASAEGSIGISLSRREKLIRPCLKIACAHPILVNELKEISLKQGIKFSIIKGKNWAGLGGLSTTSITSVINFLKLGGFIGEIKIASSRSRYLGGLEKQEVLLGILEFINQQRIDKNKRTVNINKIYKKIQIIIKNKEYNKKRYICMNTKRHKKHDYWICRKTIIRKKHYV